jgi:hypothetical protein
VWNSRILQTLEYTFRIAATMSSVSALVNLGSSDTPAKRLSMSIVLGQHSSWPDALPFERLVPALDLPVRLRVKGEVRTCVIPEIRMNSLRSLGDELRTIVRDDPGPRVWVLLLRPLQDDLDVQADSTPVKRLTDCLHACAALQFR